MDYQFARLARRLMGLKLGENTPDFADLLTPERDWREFDPQLWEELELERDIRKMESILKPDIRD
jgi:hypothetical protein